MEDLDKRLELVYQYIWGLIMNGQKEEDYADTVTEMLKTEFRSAGYVQLSQEGIDDSLSIVRNVWLERLLDELNGYDCSFDEKNTIMVAARKASNIE